MTTAANILSTKLLYVKDSYTDGTHAKYYHEHWCPACKTMHRFAVDQPFNNGAKWGYNNNPNHPTFIPSMNIRIGPYPSDDEDFPGKIDVCHYFLHDGVIRYLSDCTHDLKGQEIALPVVPESVLLSYSLLPNKENKNG